MGCQPRAPPRCLGGRGWRAESRSLTPRNFLRRWLLLLCQVELFGIPEQPVKLLSTHSLRSVSVRQPVGEQRVADEGEVIVGKLHAENLPGDAALLANKTL